jgi:uncharacterized membrane protein YbhN (UPF0104 family)
MRQFVSLAAKVAISALLLYFALRRLDLVTLGERLKHADIGWLVAAMALTAIQVALASARWQQVALQCGAELSLPRAFRLSLIATFFNQVLPSTVGGDAVRVWMLARGGAGWEKATYSVLLDRFIGVLALAVLVVLCLPWALELIHNPVGRIALLLIGFGSIAGAAAFMALGSLRWDWLQSFWPIQHLTKLAVTARALFASGQRAAVVIALSLTIHVLSAAIAWCAARAVAAPFEFVHALLLIPPVILIATVPISIAGWGVRESALMLAFGYAGLPPGDGLLVSVLIGVTMFAVGLGGGAAWLVGTDSILPPNADDTPETRR